MKVLFFSPLAALSYHFETDLELIKKHQERGDEVFVIGCDGSLKALNYFGCQGLLRCQMCQSKWKQGIDLLNVGADSQSKCSFKLSNLNKWNFKTISDLKQIKYKNVDIGAAALSTLVSNIRESNPDVGKFRDTIESMLDSLVGLTDFTENILDSLKPDLVYFFNGRFSLYRPMMRLCQQKGVEFYVQERGGNLNRYSLTHNTYPHDLNYKKKEILDTWELSPLSLEEKRKLSVDWYESRRGGVNQSWYSFTDKQIEGILPKDFDRSKRNMAIYISSEDEFAAIEEWNNPYFSSQIEGIKFILSNLKDNKDIFFYIRIHPNLKGLKNSQIRDLNALEFENVKIIQADDPISSYYFMDQCEKTITFGSTVGAESVYSGKPSILVGRTFYEDLDGLTRPKDKFHLIELIRGDLPTPSKDGVLPYAFWLSNMGIPFDYFRPKSLSTGYFMGVEIKGNKWLQYFSGFFVFLLNLKFVFQGRMGLHFLLNRLLNKIR